MKYIIIQNKPKSFDPCNHVFISQNELSKLISLYETVLYSFEYNKAYIQYSCIILFKLYYDFELPKDRKLKPCRIKTPENGGELFFFCVENDVSFFGDFF